MVRFVVVFLEVFRHSIRHSTHSYAYLRPVVSYYRTIALQVLGAVIVLFTLRSVHVMFRSLLVSLALHDLGGLLSLAAHGPDQLWCCLLI